VSANNDTQSKDDGIAAGMDYFLFKPFVYKDLVQILRDESRLDDLSRNSEKNDIASWV
jgi:CheY-like chemotaxis protein